KGENGVLNRHLVSLANRPSAHAPFEVRCKTPATTTYGGARPSHSPTDSRARHGDEPPRRALRVRRRAQSEAAVGASVGRWRPLETRAPEVASPSSRHRLRSVLRLTPSRRAARSLLPPASARAWRSSGRPLRA